MLGKGVKVLGLVEVCVEGSANDQPPHLTGPSSNLIQLGISQKSAHGKVVDIAIATCSRGLGREEGTTRKVMGHGGQSNGKKQKAKDTETGKRRRDQQKVVRGWGMRNTLLGRQWTRGWKATQSAEDSRQAEGRTTGKYGEGGQGDTA